MPLKLGTGQCERASGGRRFAWTFGAGRRALGSGAAPGPWRLQREKLDDDAPTGDIAIAPEETRPALKSPPMFKVLLLNDDYTPMEFVVHVLEAFFGMEREKAVQIMLAVHTAGSAVVGIYPRDIAETKSEQVNQYARENQHPLLSTVEMTD